MASCTSVAVDSVASSVIDSSSAAEDGPFAEDGVDGSSDRSDGDSDSGSLMRECEQVVKGSADADGGSRSGRLGWWTLHTREPSSIVDTGAELHFEVSHKLIHQIAEFFVVFPKRGHDVVAVVLQYVSDARRILDV